MQPHGLKDVWPQVCQQVDKLLLASDGSAGRVVDLQVVGVHTSLGDGRQQHLPSALASGRTSGVDPVRTKITHHLICFYGYV